MNLSCSRRNPGGSKSFPTSPKRLLVWFPRGSVVFPGICVVDGVEGKYVFCTARLKPCRRPRGETLQEL